VARRRREAQRSLSLGRRTRKASRPDAMCALAQYGQSGCLRGLVAVVKAAWFRLPA